MAVLAVLGLMNLACMAVIYAVVFIEKKRPLLSSESIHCATDWA